MSDVLHFRVGKSILLAESQTDQTFAATLYPALPNVDVERLPEAPPHVLRAIPHLRVDTVNGCNLECVFCHSDFSGKVAHLKADDFAEAIGGNKFANLQLLTFGCAYEPLLGRHFEDFPQAMRARLNQVVGSEIVTNGLLLHRKDLAPWRELGMKKLYVSVYSHIADIYEKTGRGGARFNQIELNLLEVRRRFPTLEIMLVNPICKSNDVDLPNFCRWAFDHIGVQSVDLRRAFFVENPSAGYPAYTYKAAASAELGRSPSLTDEEWRDAIESCAEFMTNADRRTLSLQGKIAYDSVILRRMRATESKLVAEASRI